jgi:hypothetical protein
VGVNHRRGAPETTEGTQGIARPPKLPSVASPGRVDGSAVGGAGRHAAGAEAAGRGHDSARVLRGLDGALAIGASRPLWQTGPSPADGQGGECPAGPALDAVNRRASASHPTPSAEVACSSVGRPRHHSPVGRAMFRVSHRGEGIDDDTLEGARGIVRGQLPGSYAVDEIRAEPFPSGHTSRQWGQLIRRPDGWVEDEPWPWVA